VLRFHLPPMLEHGRGRCCAVMADGGHTGNITIAFPPSDLHR
jgi:hypothetical protein